MTVTELTGRVIAWLGAALPVVLCLVGLLVVVAFVDGRGPRGAEHAPATGLARRGRDHRAARHHRPPRAAPSLPGRRAPRYGAPFTATARAPRVGRRRS